MLCLVLFLDCETLQKICFFFYVLLVFLFFFVIYMNVCVLLVFGSSSVKMLGIVCEMIKRTDSNFDVNSIEFEVFYFRKMPIIWLIEERHSWEIKILDWILHIYVIPYIFEDRLFQFIWNWVPKKRPSSSSSGAIGLYHGWIHYCTLYKIISHLKIFQYISDLWMIIIWKLFPDFKPHKFSKFYSYELYALTQSTN